MKAFIVICLTIAAYYLIAALLFGSAFAPLGFATFWSDRLGAPYWKAVVVVAIAISALIFAHPIKTYVTPILRLPLFVVASLTLSTLFVGLYADWKRRE